MFVHFPTQSAAAEWLLMFFIVFTCDEIYDAAAGEVLECMGGLTHLFAYTCTV